MPEPNGEQPKKPTIDERLEALVMSLELEKREREKWERKMKLLDARERQGRKALMAAVVTYLEVISKPVEGEEEENGGGEGKAG